MILPDLLEKIQDTYPQFPDNIRLILRGLSVSNPDMPEEMLLEIGQNFAQIHAEFLSEISEKDGASAYKVIVKFADKTSEFIQRVTYKYGYIGRGNRGV